ncbi:hypothetical protein CPB85DRAFT_1422667 [Mucidula mucida]|nr:hypothetical protein CPB85DRAFT_1422667 [Mucidula mucida]
MSIVLPSIHDIFPEHFLGNSRRLVRGSSSNRPEKGQHRLSLYRRSPSLNLETWGEWDEGSVERKHICNLCHRGFNRPSSLRIHMNTHTGATPFVCPFPGCGRAFNVNSNMRRHYRHHPTSMSQHTVQAESPPPSYAPGNSAEKSRRTSPRYSPSSSGTSTPKEYSSLSQSQFVWYPTSRSNPTSVWDVHPEPVGRPRRH